MNSQAELSRVYANAVRSVIPDLLRSRAGMPHSASAEPLIRELRDSDLGDIAKELIGGNSAYPTQTRDWHEALAEGMDAILQDTWKDHSKDLNPFVRDREIDNFRQTEVYNVEFAELTEQDSDASEPVYIGAPQLTSSGTAQIKSYETLFRVNRTIWQSYGAELTRAVLHHSRAIFNLELRLIAELVNSNPTMPDGNAFFTGNTGSGALSVSTLDAAMDHLGVVGLSGLMVSSGAATARKVLADCGLQVPVLLNPDLTAGTWLAFADPNENAAVLRLKIKGGSGAPRIGWVKEKGAYAFAGFHDVGFITNDRDGVYRGTA